jgi:WD40 repeat protein
VVHGVAFSPDGKSAISGGADQNVSLWDLTTGKVAKKFYGHWGDVQAVAFTPDGKDGALGERRRVDAGMGRGDGPPAPRVRPRRARSISLSVSADGARAVTGSRDATALIWDLTKLDRRK